MTSRALILGCAGKTLSPDETAFFRDVRPWGFILFKRNIGTPDEVRALTASLRATIGRDDAPILIDQEGGRVQRMGPPHWPAYPAGGRFRRLDG
ncbi:beta-hexosaminidase, partial [Methylobacterium sp. WL6]